MLLAITSPYPVCFWILITHTYSWVSNPVSTAGVLKLQVLHTWSRLQLRGASKGETACLLAGGKINSPTLFDAIKEERWMACTASAAHCS
eukprot:scaffold6082_cov23-Tisochrysis_lutea.AAC.2